jgi:hypothetical protein
VCCGQAISIPQNTIEISTGSGKDVVERIEEAEAKLKSGGTVKVPAGKWIVNRPIGLNSNITLQGNGPDSTFLIGGRDLGAKAVVQISGTEKSRLSNIRITQLAVQNGEPQLETYTSGMDGIRAETVDHLKVDHIRVSSIQGAYGIAVTKSSDVEISDDDVRFFTYAGIAVLNNSETIRIIRNTVDTATMKGGVRNSYGIIVGGYEHSKEPGRFPRYVWVQHNIVKNIPVWQGLNSHGGEHLWYTDNVVENVHTGINIALAENGIAEPALSDVHIERNTVTQGAGLPDGYGLLVQGGISNGKEAAGVWILENTVTGFGATPTAPGANIPAVDLAYSKNIHVNRNVIRKYNQCAILLNEQVVGGEVQGNVVEDMVSAKQPAISSMVLGNNHVDGITVEKNELRASGNQHRPKYMFHSTNPATVRVRYDGDAGR